LPESSNCPVVLLIDDDPVLRLLAVEALEGSGFEVIEAEGGVQALASFAARVPALVLLDLMMPDVDGFAVCERLRSMPSGAGVPIMVMTGLDDAASIDRAYEAGATDFVTKPINYGLLAHRLRYLLRAASAFRAERASTRRLGRAQQLARLGQWELDLDSRQFCWSDEAKKIFMLPACCPGAGAGCLLRLVHPEDRGRVEAALQDPRAHQIEYRLLLADGRERVVRQDAEIIEDPETGARLLSGAAQDVTELRDAERKVRDLAYFDSLTGLPNRALLSSFLAHALTEAQRDQRFLAILSLDLDGFKRVNDTFGHSAGDALLKEVASRVTSCIRATDAIARGDVSSLSIERQLTADSIASRLGGDEFVVVLSHVGSRENVALVARRIADRLAAVYSVGGTEVFVSSSIGIACFPDAGNDVEALLERADAAMYHAKESGRNQFQFFTAGLQDKARQRLVLENALRVSLARSGIHPRRAGVDPLTSEFLLEYQPKVAIPSGQVLGVEALLRWTSPELGVVSPMELIPIAEETGLIVPLGEWVLRAACVQAKAWADERRETDLRVAVNVSARQFRDPELPAVVAGVLAETGLAPELLELEITEGVLMQDTVGSSLVLGALKRLGLRIALDDFGTGYSSLSYLTRLPIDTIKIDRSFISDPDASGRSATITSAIIGLSRGLDIDVVVEGVETQAQLDFISQHGSTEIQGYFFARPMSVAGLHEWRAERDAGAGPVPSSTPRIKAA
jgi:predicted signal transduction protein with EAL and GGDEF domain/DNA-binding response OmpR family regulator